MRLRTNTFGCHWMRQPMRTRGILWISYLVSWKCRVKKLVPNRFCWMLQRWILWTKTPSSSFSLIRCDSSGQKVSELSSIFQTVVSKQPDFLCFLVGLNTDKLLLVTTAATPYMCDAMIKLSEIFPKMIHVNCVARDLQHISELVRLRAADVEALICRVASVFDKSPLFRHEFRELYANIPLPPTSTQFTQWSTWIEAAIYYTQYFAEIIAALSRFSESDTAVREAHDAFLAHTVKQTLAFIGFNFHSFADAIKEIQKRGIPLARSIQHIDEVYVPLDAMNHPFFRDEFDKLMERNPGFEKLKSINCILNGRPCDDDHIERYTPVELLKYALAPITMCNVEHSFSAYKSVLLERDVPPNQLREHLVVYCNDFWFENSKSNSFKSFTWTTKDRSILHLLIIQ